MGFKRGTLGIGLVAGLVAGCGSLPDQTAFDGDGRPEARAIITSGGDFAMLRNTAVPVREVCDIKEILAQPDTTGSGPGPRLTSAFDCGEALFDDVFNELDGVGAKVGQGRRFTRTPRPDLSGSGEWLWHVPPRTSGPSAASCTECHQGPGAGAGGNGANEIRDPNRASGFGQLIERQPPHLFGLAMLQRVAEEITADLQSQLVAARARLIGGVTSTQQTFTSKRLVFGTATVTATSVIGLRTIDPDLVVKPFAWKGNAAFVRDVVRGSANNALGMQPTELAGQNLDGDFDGTVNELVVGDVSALTAYVANQPRPVTTVELDTLGLINPALTAAQKSDIDAGLAQFNIVGCNACHTPMLTIANPVETEPSQSALYRDALTFPNGTDNPVTAGVDPSNPISANLITDIIDNRIAFPAPRAGDLLGGAENGRDAFGNRNGTAVVRAFTDFQRHFLGANLAEQVDDGVPANLWLTRALWGVASTAPYLHDGRATTLMSAILEHDKAGDTPASEARSVIVRVRQLTQTAQRQLDAFLKSLVLFRQ